MMNIDMIKTLIISELKWKANKFTKVILINVCLFAFIYFVFPDILLDQRIAFVFMVASVMISHSSILPSLNKNLVCTNFSWNYYLTLTYDKKSLLLGTYLAGFITRIPLVISSSYLLYSLKMFKGDLLVILIVTSLGFIVCESYKLSYGISLTKKVSSSLSVSKTKTIVFSVLSKTLGSFNFIISLAAGTIIFNGLYSISPIYGSVGVFIIFIVANIYFFKSVLLEVYSSNTDSKTLKRHVKTFFALLAVIVLCAIFSAIYYKSR